MECEELCFLFFSSFLYFHAFLEQQRHPYTLSEFPLQNTYLWRERERESDRLSDITDLHRMTKM